MHSAFDSPLSFWTPMMMFRRGDNAAVVSAEIPCCVGSRSPRHGASSDCGWRRRPQGMEGSCLYTE